MESTSFESKVVFNIQFGDDYQVEYIVYIERGDYDINLDDWLVSEGDTEASESEDDDVVAYEATIGGTRELERAVEELDHFQVIDVDDLDSDTDLTIRAETGQKLGVLFFSQDEDTALDFEENFRMSSTDTQMLYSTGDVAWELEEGEVYYWYRSYVASRDAVEGEAEVKFFIEQGRDELEYTVDFVFGDRVNEEEVEDWDWAEFEE